MDLKRTFTYKVSQIGTIEASSELSSEYSAENLFSEDENKTWRPADNDLTPEITITLSQKDMFDKVVMQEYIANGQHVEGYELYIDRGDGKWEKVGTGGVVGYKKIHKITPVEVVRIKIKITSYRGNLEMNSVVMY